MRFRRRDDTPSEIERVSQRIEVIDALLAAQREPERLLSICRAAASWDEAYQQVQAAFEVSGMQAHFMLDMRFAQQTVLGRQSMESERAELQAQLDRVITDERTNDVEGQ